MRACLGLDHCGIVGQFEVVLAVVQAQHQLLDGFFGFLDLARVGGGDGDVLGIVRAEQAHTGGGVGDGNAVVAVGVAGAGAFFGEHADHLEGYVFDQDVLADRVGHVLEQFGPHLVPDHRDRRGVLFIGVGEVAAFDHRPVENRREVGVVAADVAHVIKVAKAHPGLLAVDRHDPHHLGQAGNRGDLIEGDDAHGRARVGRRAAEVNDVGTERAHLRHHLALAAFTHGQHDHHRGDTDDDPEQGQRGAELVDPHHPPRRVHGIDQFTLPGAGGFGAFTQALAQVDGL
ncbi:hypothetical protein D3C73_579600 [compost metagenome]